MNEFVEKAIVHEAVKSTGYKHKILKSSFLLLSASLMCLNWKCRAEKAPANAPQERTVPTRMHDHDI